MKNFDEQRAIAEQGGVSPTTGLWKFDYKVITTPTDGATVIDLFLPTLERRRIYLFLEAQLVVSTQDFLVYGELDFLRGGASRAKLPVQIGRDVNLDFIDQPVVNFFPDRDAPGTNAIQLTLSKAFFAGSNPKDVVIVSPYEMDVAADQCIFRILASKEKAQTAKPKIRVWLGVLSMTPT